MAISILRAVMVSNSHCQSQPLIHYISSIDENAKRRKRVVFSSSHSSELNPVIRLVNSSFFVWLLMLNNFFRFMLKLGFGFVL